MWPVGRGAVAALPVFLACINRGEFCKALSTSSEVKCGRGATKQKATPKLFKKDIQNYLNYHFFLFSNRIVYWRIYHQFILLFLELGFIELPEAGN